MDIKRIAVISYHTCPLSDEKNADVGGMNTYVLELSKALAEKGHIIDIFTRCVDTRSPKIVEVETNLRVIHLPEGEFSKNILKFLKEEKVSYNSSIARISSSAYDLISTHYYSSGVIGLELKKEIKVPLFVTFHTLALMKNLVGKSEDVQRIQSELLLTQKADKIIATSDSDLEYIHTLYNCPLKKIALLSPGVDLKLFRPINKLEAKKNIRADLGHKLILFVGRIEPLKGIDVLLYAVRILTRRNPNLCICLWIVGGNTRDDKEVKRLEEIRKVLGITLFVKFIGKKAQEELPYYYNSAEVVLMPSRYESFGITALEAMACAVPVVITDVAGVSGLLDKKHNSLLTSASNPIKLAKKIKNLLTNEVKYKKMSEEVFKKVQDLSWENVADKFTQILSQV